MKILFIGDYYLDIYAKSFYQSCKENDVTAIKFDTDAYFSSIPNLVGLKKKRREICR